MTDFTASFQAPLSAGIATAATRDTTASFEANLTFATQVIANANALSLTPDTAASLTLSVDTPQTLVFS